MSRPRRRIGVVEHGTSVNTPLFDIVIESIPFVPLQVQWSDLDARLRLIETQEPTLALTQQGKVKKTGEQRYSIFIDENGDQYRIYGGVKRQAALGEGSFAKVRLAQKISDGSWYAFKSAKSHMLNEFTIQKELGIGYGIHHGYSSRRGKVRHLVLTKLGRGITMEEMIEEMHYLSPFMCMKIMQSALEQLQLLHAQHIIHRDIKPANMMVNPVTGEVSLIDYDFAIKVEANQPVLIKTRKVGTPSFLSREGFMGIYSYFTDSYAMGCSFAELLRMRLENQNEERGRITLHPTWSADELLGHHDLMLYLFDLVTHMTAYKIKDRLSIADALENINVLSNLYRNYLDQSVKIITLDVDDYDAFKNKAFLKAMLVKTNHDRVILVEKMGAERRSLAYYAKVTNFLRRMGARCDQSLYRYTTVYALHERIRQLFPQCRIVPFNESGLKQSYERVLEQAVHKYPAISLLVAEVNRQPSDASCFGLFKHLPGGFYHLPVLHNVHENQGEDEIVIMIKKMLRELSMQLLNKAGKLRHYFTDALGLNKKSRAWINSRNQVIDGLLKHYCKDLIRYPAYLAVINNKEKMAGILSEIRQERPLLLQYMKLGDSFAGCANLVTWIARENQINSVINRQRIFARDDQQVPTIHELVTAFARQYYPDLVVNAEPRVRKTL